MYENAEGMNAKYGTTGTGITTSKFVPYLNNRGFRCDTLSNYSFNKVKNSINNKAPVLIIGYSGAEEKHQSFLWWKWNTTNYKDGHAWVIDGYCNMQCTATNKNDKTDVKTFTTNYVHCNLGWSGSCNGYYIDKVFTANLGANASDGKVEQLTRSAYEDKYYYQYYLKVVTNIRPKN